MKGVLWNSKRVSSALAAAPEAHSGLYRGRRTSSHSSDGGVARPAPAVAGTTWTRVAEATVLTRRSLSAQSTLSDQCDTRKTSRCAQTSKGIATLALTSSEGTPK